MLDVSLGADDRRYVSSLLDPYNFGHVSPLTFKRFLRTFGDLNRMPKKVIQKAAGTPSHSLGERYLQTKIFPRLLGREECKTATFGRRGIILII